MQTDRLPPLPPESWSDVQRREAEAVISGPRGALISPFIPLLRSPELMGHAQRMGEYLRYRSALPLQLSELAILITARRWTQQVEWAIHAPIAQREGVSQETILAIAEGRRPESLPEAQAVVYDFSTELHVNGGVSEATWSRALASFGEQGTVDLIGINGYYTFLSMVMNAAGTPAPASDAPALPPMPLAQ